MENKAMEYLQRISQSPAMGIFYGILGTISFSSAHLFAQVALLSSQELSKLAVFFIRTILEIAVLVPFILQSGTSILTPRENWLQMLVFGLNSFFCNIFLYYALPLIPLADVFTLSATAPFIAAILSFFLLKERWYWIDTVCGILSLLGVLLITRPVAIFGKYGTKEQMYYSDENKSTSEFFFLIGCLFAVCFGIGRAVWVVMSRRWSKENNAFGNQLVLIFYASIFTFLVTPPIMIFKGETIILPKPLFGRCSLFAVGICTVVGSISFMLATDTQNATVICIIRNLEVVESFVLQYLVMNIVPSFWSIGGAMVIICSTIIASFRLKISNYCGSCCQRNESGCKGEEKKKNTDDD